MLVKGNVLHFPDHVPFLDSTVDMAAAGGGGPAKGGDPWDGIVGHPAAAEGGDAKGRQVVLYTRDNRRLELRQVEGGPGGGQAVEVTVGHWRSSKALLCQTRVIGDPGQVCFKPEALAGGAVRLVPTGKGGDTLSLTPLPEGGIRQIAQD